LRDSSRFSRARTVRTRFAPSPTGFLHIGGARTALFSWAYARRHGGTFILRIEDTDVERSTPEAVQAILDGMAWLGLAHDEGPFYQMQRMDRYREVIGQMLAAGKAYHCYAAKRTRRAARGAARARREAALRRPLAPRERGGRTPPPPDVKPVVRFRNPDARRRRRLGRPGQGPHRDRQRRARRPHHRARRRHADLQLLRGGRRLGHGITHVIRGDDHVNNTPRQINILRALGAPLPLLRATCR
jgi:glutamyl-tRNA synthetase